MDQYCTAESSIIILIFHLPLVNMVPFTTALALDTLLIRGNI